MTLALLAVAWLLTYLLHSTILLGGAWLLSATRAVRSPVVQDTVWKVCLVGGLLTATIQTAWPVEGLGPRFWLPSVMAPAAAAAPAVRETWVAPAAAAGVAARPATHLRARAAAAAAPITASPARVPASATPTPYTLPPTPSLSWPQALLGIWILGAGALLVRVSTRRLRFCRRLDDRRELVRGELIEMLESLRAAAGVRRRVRLAVSSELSGPVAMGRSEICLPDRVLTSLSGAEQRAVLAHELGHLVRQDPSWLAVAVVVENLLFLQPLHRLARRGIQEAAEYLCDDWAVHHGGGSLTLAKCLAEVATWMQAAGRAVPVSGMAENRSQLVARVQRLLDGVEPRAVRGLRLAVPVAALALSTVAFAAPGVLPCTCTDAAAGGGAAAWQDRAGVVAVSGAPHLWATIRDGHVVTFRSGFAPRIIGVGRIGIRRGGRAIELMDDQRLTVNGRVVDDGGEVEVRESDRLRIVDAGGRTLWSLEPVRLTRDQVRAVESMAVTDDEDVAPADAAADAGDAWDEDDSVQLDSDDVLDTAEIAAASRQLGRLGERLGRDISVQIVPQVAQVQRLAVRLAGDMAPRLAEMGMSIAADLGPELARAFGDSACDSTDSRAPRAARRRAIDGAKRLRP